MKNNNMKWLFIAICILIILPIIVANVVPSDAGMMASIVLFMVINPIFALITGIFSGKRRRERSGLPLFFVFFYVMGTWISFEWGSTQFFGYALAYFAISFVAMLISSYITDKKSKE